MNDFRIAAPDLSTQDRLVLRSALRLLCHPGRRWSFAEDEREATLVLRRLAPTRDEQGGPRASQAELPDWVRLDLGSLGSDVATADLMLPLRARDLVPYLRLAESKLDRPSGRPHERSLRPDTLTLVITRMLSDAGPLRSASILMRIGERDALTIESGESAARADLRSLAWRSDSIPDLGALGERVRQGAAVALVTSRVPATDSPGGAPLCSGNVGQLIWLLAIHDPRPELAPNLRRDQSLALLRWPDIRGLPLRGQQLRLAALLARDALSIQQLVATSKVTESEVVAFVNACHWLGYLAIGGVSISTPSASRGISKPARGFGGLVESIRTALLGAVAREPR